MTAAPKSVRQQFADTMLDVGVRDERLVVMVGDISHGILQPFAEACPERYYNVGILEPTMISMGAGLARAGLRPVLHTIAPFIVERGFEQIKLGFCYHRLPGNIVTVGSAFDYANLGCTHHCYGDFALLKTLPGVELVCPGSAIEFDTLFRQAYADDAMTYFRVPAHPHGVRLSQSDIRLGKAIRLVEGSDVLLVAAGPQLRTALGAREILAAGGIDAEVIYIHTVRPLDEEMLRASVGKTRRVVVIEEHMRSGGLGDEVLKATWEITGLRFDWAAIPDVFVTGYGTYEDHCETCGLTPDAVATRARNLM